MKKLLLLLVAPCIVFSTLSAQITQKEADDIVQQRLDGETKPYTVYAKETVQTEGFTVITATGETLALEYPCWVYYVDYAGDTNGKYLIVKGYNGNLLEIKTKKDTGPDDYLAEWRMVSFEISFTEYSLEGTDCQWTNLDYDETVIIINSEEELENYTSCSEGSYPEIDFSQYTLLLASGTTDYEIEEITEKILLQLSSNEYQLKIEIYITDTTAIGKTWTVALIVKKLWEEAIVELKLDIRYVGPFCSVWKCVKIEQFPFAPTYDIFLELAFYPSEGKLIVESDLLFGWPDGTPLAGTYDYYIDENDVMYWIPNILGNNWKIYYKSENEMILQLYSINPPSFYFVCKTKFNDI